MLAATDAAVNSILNRWRNFLRLSRHSGYWNQSYAKLQWGQALWSWLDSVLDQCCLLWGSEELYYNLPKYWHHPAYWKSMLIFHCLFEIYWWTHSSVFVNHKYHMQILCGDIWVWIAQMEVTQLAAWWRSRSVSTSNSSASNNSYKVIYSCWIWSSGRLDVSGTVKCRSKPPKSV